MSQQDDTEKQHNRRLALQTAQAIALAKINEGVQVLESDVIDAAAQYRDFLDG